MADYRDGMGIADTEAPPPRAGDGIGRHKLVRPLGQGGMGEVWLAHDPSLGREVAIKLQRCSSADDHRRSLREGRALAAVTHDNVLPVYEVGVAGDRTYLVMEHIAGDTLRGELRRRGHTVAEVVALFVAAARGLGALHAAGLVHCDFKPENVLVQHRAGAIRVLLCDLGLAANDVEFHATGGDDVSDLATTPGFGTPRYMAPEQHDGETPTPRSDQYAWCAALFEAVWGRPPFLGDAEGLLQAKRKGLGPTDAATTHRRLRDVLARGLAPSAAERFADMDAAVAAVRSATRAPRRWPLVVPLAGLALVGYASDRTAVPPTIDAGAIEIAGSTPSGEAAATLELADRADADGDLELAVSLGGQAYELAHSDHDRDVAALAAARTFRRVSDLNRDEREAERWRGLAAAALAEVEADHAAWHDYDEGMFNVEYSAGHGGGAWPALTTMLMRAHADPIDGARAWVVGLQFHAELTAVAGDLQDADRHAAAAVTAAREAFGNDHGETAAALLAASLAATRAGAPERGLALVEEAGRILDRLYPPEHVRMINFGIAEASAWAEIGEYGTAFASVARARELQRRTAPSSLGLAAQLDGMAGVLARRMGDIDLARRLQYSALVAAEAELGSEHPRVGLRLHNLAVLEQSAGDCAKAREYATRAERIYAAEFPEDHPQRLGLAAAVTCDRSTPRTAGGE